MQLEVQCSSFDLGLRNLSRTVHHEPSCDDTVKLLFSLFGDLCVPSPCASKINRQREMGIIKGGMYSSLTQKGHFGKLYSAFTHAIVGRYKSSK